MKEIWRKCEYFRKNTKEDEYDSCTHFPKRYGGTCYSQVFHEKCEDFKIKFTVLMEEAIAKGKNEF